MRLLLLIFILLTPMVAYGDTLTVTPFETPIAKNVEATLSITLNEGEKARLPDVIPLPEGAELIARKTPPSIKQENGARIYKVVWEFALYKVGEAQIGEFEYEIDKTDGEMEKRKAGPMPIKVVSIRTDEKTARQIKSVTPPTRPKFRWQAYIIPVLILIAAFVAGIFFWRWLKKRERPEFIAPPPPPRPAHEVAYEQLEKLKAEDPFGHGMAKAHFFRLSEITRGYMEHRFGLLALERTTLELRKEFDNKYVPNEVRVKLMNLLGFCDIVKFTKKEANATQAEEAVAQAYEFVDATRVKQEEPPQ